MRNYDGPLLDVIEPDEVTDEIPECDGSFMHYGARTDTIAAICLGERIKLTRRITFPSADETPGVVEGHCYAMSSMVGGRIVLAVETEDGSVGVDVSNPREWHWQVGSG